MSSRPLRALIERDTVVRRTPEDMVRRAVKTMAQHVSAASSSCRAIGLVGIFTERDLLIRVAATGRDLDRTRDRRGDDTRARHHRGGRARRRGDPASMAEFSYRYLPVIENDKVLGVISSCHLPFGEMRRHGRGSWNNATTWRSGRW